MSTMLGHRNDWTWISHNTCFTGFLGIDMQPFRPFRKQTVETPLLTELRNRIIRGEISLVDLYLVLLS